MNITANQLYSFLSDRMDKDIAEKLTMYIDSKIHQAMTEKTNNFATREDLANLKIELVNMQKDMLRWFMTIFITLIIAAVGVVLKN
jgi:hypothetical protein